MNFLNSTTRFLKEHHKVEKLEATVAATARNGSSRSPGERAGWTDSKGERGD
jgi:hypothetical protein